MGGRIWIDLAKLLAAFLALWLALSYVPDYLPSRWFEDWNDNSESLTLSIEDEEQLGEFLMDNVLNEYELEDNAIVDSAIHMIKQRLMPLVSASEYDYNIIVVQDDQINAITLPGANILVFTGLIEFAESPEEVAAVIAHEIGHVEQRHIVNKLVAEIGLTLAMTIVTGGDATIIHSVASTLISNVYSRSQEAEADKMGMQLLVDANIHPGALGQFFKNLNEHDMGFSEYYEWLMTHPHNDQRIEESDQFKVPENFEEIPIDLDWVRVKASI